MMMIMVEKTSSRSWIGIFDYFYYSRHTFILPNGIIEIIEILDVMTNNYLWSHISFSPNPVVQLNIDGIRNDIVSHSKTQITDGAGAVCLDENILRLEISVSDGRFTLRTDNLHVKMSKTSCHGQGHSHHSINIHRRTI